MSSKECRAFAALGALAMTVIWAAPAGAQVAEVKEKPPMYTYVSNWNIPRARWAEMEKLLADGWIHEYEIDVPAIHTEAPGTFWIFYITPNAEGVDKVSAALNEALKANALAGPAISSMVDFTPHRDELARTNATYK